MGSFEREGVGPATCAMCDRQPRKHPPSFASSCLPSINTHALPGSTHTYLGSGQADGGERDRAGEREADTHRVFLLFV
jgi:hypothetical protein